MNNYYNIGGLVEGDQIQVLTNSGSIDTGVFLRFEDGFLIWVRNNNGNCLFSLTSVDGITISKL